MASGPYADPRRGTWSVQWFNGVRWCRTVVVRKRPGWKPGDPMPKKPPPEAIAELAAYTRKEQLARQRKGVNVDLTVAEFLAAHVEGYAGRKAGSKLELEKVVAVFLAWCKENKIERLRDVTSAIAHRWMDHRARTKAVRTGEPIAHATLKKERGLLMGAWSEALKRETVERNPWIAVEVPGKPSTKERGSWTPDELTRLLAVADRWLADLLLIGCHTGLRIAALIALEWRDIKWTKDGPGFGFVIVRPEIDKAGKGYRVPIDQTLHDVLARRLIHRDAHTTHVLTSRRSQPIKKSFISDRAIRAACKRAGLKMPDSPNHHMRRSFGRQAVLGQLTGRPIPIYVVSKWLGHSSIQMTEKYLALSHDESAKWMEEYTGESHAPRLGNAEDGQDPVAT